VPATLADAIVASLQEGLMVVDRDGTITRANDAVAQLWGVPGRELAGSSWAALAHELYDSEGSRIAVGHTPVARALDGETVRGALVQIVRRDGTAIWAEVNALPLAGTDGSDRGALTTYVDVTERLHRERRMRREADSDPLTGLANRRALERTLRTAVDRARRSERELALLLIDLDGFKEVNDRYGHLAGDHALRTVAERLRRCVRERDLVARTGGDEFVVVLPDVHPGAPVAEECRARVDDALTAPLRFEGGSTTIGAAIGIATFPRDGSDGLALLAHADREMYAAKAR
jgi:diguanylate cyclase (GGDEF)-like protein/PAS domain S-box-containing protein